jgi:hypothetical protein
MRWSWFGGWICSYDCRSCVMGNTGHVTWRRLSSAFKTVHLLTCLIHKCSVFSMKTTFKPHDFQNAFPMSQVPDNSTVFCFVARFREKCSASDRKVSGHPAVLYDVCKTFCTFQCNIHQNLYYIIYSFNSPWTLQSVRRHSAIAFDSH